MTFLLRSLILFVGCLISFSAFAQTGGTTNELANQVPKKPIYDDSIIDPVYGINIYDRLNLHLEADSIRQGLNGYAVQAWIEDHYANGNLLHRGYYIDGQLQVYKNYYPNGQLEREFKSIDNYRSLMRKYYPNGILKSEVRYVEGSALEWTDYFNDGTVEYQEVFHKSFSYHLKRAQYKKSGQPSELFELINKKKLIFSQQEFHDNGQLKEAGELHYDKNIFDFYRIGKWSVYDTSGNLVKDMWYDDGEVTKEKIY